jgi:hypothetical protein
VPSRKQRRRRQKERRHEYEYVYVDDEGQEVEVPEEDEPRAPARVRDQKGGSSRQSATRGRGRRVDPPSWRRVGKRALFLGPVMFIMVNLIGRDWTTGQRIGQTLFLLVLFLPFSYLMDSMMYRAYLKRTGTAPPARRRGSNGRA